MPDTVRNACQDKFEPNDRHESASLDHSHSVYHIPQLKKSKLAKKGLGPGSKPYNTKIRSKTKMREYVD